MCANRGLAIILYNDENNLKILTGCLGSGKLNIVGRESHVSAME